MHGWIDRNGPAEYRSPKNLQLNKVTMPSAVQKHHDPVHDVQRDRKPLSSESNPQPMMGSNDVITLNEAAELLRVHPVTLRKRAVAWGVPHRRLGAEWRFSRKVLTAWIQRREEDAA
jgi:excisionase family DNA binding protein